MSPNTIYCIVFAFLLVLVVFLQKKFCILCNQCPTPPKPYSFSRTQLVWWTFIIFASFISIVLASGKIPTFSDSSLILLGIGSLTTVSARLIDINDNQSYQTAVNAAATNAQQQQVAAQAPVSAPAPAPAPPTEADPNSPVPAVASAPAIATPVPSVPQLSQQIWHDSFLLDILSDKNGICIHRLQAVVFNFIFGGWFIYTSFQNLRNITVASAQSKVDAVIPIITSNNLILLGVSAGLYATLKSTENK